MEIRRKNLIDIYNNQLREVEQEELETKHTLQLIQEKKMNILNNRKDAGIKKYNNSNKRKQLLDDAELLGFSSTEIEILRQYIQQWDPDNVTNEIIDKFENLEKYIKKQAPHKKSFLYKIGSLPNNNGGTENDN